jgi:hypothetical protein
VNIAIQLYPRVVDKENFAAMVQSAFKFEEDRNKIREALRL